LAAAKKEKKEENDVLFHTKIDYLKANVAN
jgi:hypothetical protein